MMHIRSYKRILLSGLLQYSGVNAALFAARARKSMLTVLCYHRVLEDDSPSRAHTEPAIVTSLDAFEQQMDLLSRRFRPVALSDVVCWLNNAGGLPPRAVLVTFDDGWSDTYTNAFPIMKRFAVPGVVFLATGFIGTTARQWADKVHGAFRERVGAESATQEVDRMKHMPASERDILLSRLDLPDDLPGENLTWEQVAEMDRAGFEFGSHTRNHIILPHERHSDILNELILSADDIQSHLGPRPDALAYPDGQYDDTACDLAGEAGYSCAFTCDEGLCTRRSNRCALPRLGIHDGVCSTPGGRFSPAMFLTYLAGSIPWRYRRVRE